MIEIDEEPKFKWILKEIAINSLKPHPKNPRKISKEKFEKLGKLIDKFGLLDKPIVNEDLTLIGGHQRINYLKKKKRKVVECLVAENQLSQEDIDELCIGLNLQQGNWDWDIMADYWEPLDLLNYGFTEDQIMGTFNEEISEESKKSSKKKKICPSCGHEF